LELPSLPHRVSCTPSFSSHCLRRMLGIGCSPPVFGFHGAGYSSPHKSLTELALSTIDEQKRMFPAPPAEYPCLLSREPLHPPLQKLPNLLLIRHRHTLTCTLAFLDAWDLQMDTRTVTQAAQLPKPAMSETSVGLLPHMMKQLPSRFRPHWKIPHSHRIRFAVC